MAADEAANKAIIQEITFMVSLCQFQFCPHYSNHIKVKGQSNESLFAILYGKFSMDISI